MRVPCAFRASCGPALVKRDSRVAVGSFGNLKGTRHLAQGTRTALGSFGNLDLALRDARLLSVRPQVCQVHPRGAGPAARGYSRGGDTPLMHLLEHQARSLLVDFLVSASVLYPRTRFIGEQPALNGRERIS